MIRLSSLLFLLPPTLYLHLVDLRLPRPATPGFLSAHPPCEAVESDNTYSRRLPAAASDPPPPLPPLLPGATTACGEPLLQPCSAQMTRCVAGSANLKGRRAALHILLAVAPCTALSRPRHRPCPPLPYYPLRQPHLSAAAGPDLQPEVHLQTAGACGQEVREGGEGREAEDQKGDREGCVRRQRPPSWPLCLCIQHVLGSRLRPPGGIAQARMQACGRPRPKGTAGLFPPHVTPHSPPLCGRQHGRRQDLCSERNPQEERGPQLPAAGIASGRGGIPPGPAGKDAGESPAPCRPLPADLLPPYATLLRPPVAPAQPWWGQPPR